jgi:hypothetical protein
MLPRLRPHRDLRLLLHRPARAGARADYVFNPSLSPQAFFLPKSCCCQPNLRYGLLQVMRSPHAFMERTYCMSLPGSWLRSWEWMRTEGMWGPQMFLHCCRPWASVNKTSVTDCLPLQQAHAISVGQRQVTGPHAANSPALLKLRPCNIACAQMFNGTVGGPLPLLTYRLEAVPEMGYDPLASPPRGEIIIKGPVVFQGYYKVPLSLFPLCAAALVKQHF